MHDESPLARLLGNGSQGVDNKIGKWRGGEGASCVSCRALGIQVGLDDRWAGERRAKVAGRTRAVATAVAHPEPPDEALKQIAHEGLVGVEGQEGGQPAVAHWGVGVGGRWCLVPGCAHGLGGIRGWGAGSYGLGGIGGWGVGGCGAWEGAMGGGGLGGLGSEASRGNLGLPLGGILR